MMIKYKQNKNKILAYFEHGDDGYCYTIWVKDITNQVLKKLKLDDSYTILVRRIAYDVLRNKSNFYGIAKCSPDDYFDIDFGKEIAKQRLLKNFYKYRDKVLQKVIDKINKIPHVDYHIFNENFLFDKLNHIVAFEKACGIKNDMEVYEYEPSD